MPWISFVIFGQFLNAFTVLIDRFIVKKAVARPIVYTFYVAVLSASVIVLLPFDFISRPTEKVIILSLLTGFAYVASIYFLYESLVISEASDVAPVMGGIGAVSALFFSYLISGSVLMGNFLYGFLFLVLGTGLMSYYRFSRRSFYYVLGAGLLFGLSSVLVKSIFSETSFINGFFWSRMGNVAGALVLLAMPACRRRLAEDIKNFPLRNKLWVAGNKFVSGIAFLSLLIAIFLSEASLVNALSGIQFIFLLFLALIFTKKFPEFFHETIDHKHVATIKIVAMALIIFGLSFLFL